MGGSSRKIVKVQAWRYIKIENLLGIHKRYGNMEKIIPVQVSYST
jgi:hypothetical protein